MNNEDCFWMGFFIGLILMFCILVVVYQITQPSYKQGQIDAINGIIKYELTKNINNELIWEKKL